MSNQADGMAQETKARYPGPVHIAAHLDCLTSSLSLINAVLGRTVPITIGFLDDGAIWAKEMLNTHGIKVMRESVTLDGRYIFDVPKRKHNYAIRLLIQYGYL